MPGRAEQRRLAAILASDIVGYSRLMANDEEATLGRLRSLRAELIDPVIDRYRGRIVKLMGDGSLVEFASVVDAIRCAIDIQAGMAARDKDLPDEQRIDLRIGVNLGDVIVDGDDIYGDGVNIASRLEGLAEPGGIVVSGTAFDYAKGKVQADFTDLGLQEVKNIPEPVRAYQVRREGAADIVARETPIRRRRASRLSIAAALVALLLMIVAGTYWLVESTDVVWQTIDRGSAFRQCRRRRGDRSVGWRTDRGHHHRSVSISMSSTLFPAIPPKSTRDRLSIFAKSARISASTMSSKGRSSVMRSAYASPRS